MDLLYKFVYFEYKIRIIELNDYYYEYVFIDEDEDFIDLVIKVIQERPDHFVFNNKHFNESFRLSKDVVRFLTGNRRWLNF